jgi:hypothetical protein
MTISPPLCRRVLQIVYIHAIAVETVLAGDLLPESSTNLVTLSYYVSLWKILGIIVEDRRATYALAGLEVNLQRQETHG